MSLKAPKGKYAIFAYDEFDFDWGNPRNPPYVLESEHKTLEDAKITLKKRTKKNDMAQRIIVDDVGNSYDS